MHKTYTFLLLLTILNLNCHLDRLESSIEGCENPPAASFSIEDGGNNCKAPCTVKIINTSTNAVDCKLIFGDGDSTIISPTGEIFHTFLNAGKYSITLIANGQPDCPSNTLVKQLTVLATNDPPTAGFSVDLSSNDGFAPCNVKFVNNSTNSSTYQWDFGDGSPVSNAVNPLHTYSTPGDFVVKLTASGTLGSDTESKTFLIKIRTFKKTFGRQNNDYGVSVVQTPDDGYALAGRSWNSPNTGDDMYIVRVDNAGELKWEQTVNNNSYSEYCEDMGYSEISGGGYLLAGYGWYGANSSNADILLSRITPTGSIEWVKQFDNLKYDVANAALDILLLPPKDEQFSFVFGKTSTVDPYIKNDIYLIKIDYFGNILWQKTYGDPISNDVGYLICESSDGNYILIGMTDQQSSGKTEYRVMKINDTGDILWETKIPTGANPNLPRSITPTSDGGYAILVDFGAMCYLLKINNDGQFIWDRAVFARGMDIQETSDGGFIITGDIVTNSNIDLYLAKLNKDGGLVWSKTFGGSQHDAGRSVKQTKDGGYVALGFTSSFSSGGSDLWLIKTDKDGNVQ